LRECIWCGLQSGTIHCRVLLLVRFLLRDMRSLRGFDSPSY
jgi:hypothetical protein